MLLPFSFLFRAWWTILFQIARIEGHQVFTCAFAFIDAMTPVGVGHELELPIVLNEFVEQHISILIMNIVVSSAMNIQ